MGYKFLFDMLVQKLRDSSQRMQRDENNNIASQQRITMGAQHQFSENSCSEDDLRSRIFGTFVVKFLAYLPLLGFSNI